MRKKKTVAFLTLGCKVNSYETDAMEKLFIDAGYQVINFNDLADIYIINTCTVTNVADRKSRQMLHRAKKKNSNAVIVAVGCYVQAAKEVIQKDPSIDIVVGNNQKNKIVEIVEKYMQKDSNEKLEGKGIVTDINKEQVYEALCIDTAGEKTRAYIKIQDGCNQFCSYCLIPHVRGRVRSRKIEDLVVEVSQLVKKGYQEVVLTGIHLSSYGVDLEEWNPLQVKQSFVDLKGKPLLDVIHELDKIEGLKRIRLGSLEPRIISTEWVKNLATYKKVCPHFHLSLQSGCNETLKRMNRKYTVEEYYEKCEILREIYVNPAITTDVIVGFPQETEEEFNLTKAFLEKVSFSQMHIFKYSKRKGTIAETMEAQVPDEIKNERSECLLKLEKEMSKSYQNLFLGTKQKVLMEENILMDGKQYLVGHNERYLKLAVESNCMEKEIQNMLTVEIIGYLKEDILLCKQIEND